MATGPAAQSFVFGNGAPAHNHLALTDSRLRSPVVNPPPWHFIFVMKLLCRMRTMSLHPRVSDLWIGDVCGSIAVKGLLEHEGMRTIAFRGLPGQGTSA